MTLAYMSVPDAYGVVESGVFRAKALDVHNLPFLLHLQIRTILYLSPEPLAKAVTDFLDTNKIKLEEEEAEFSEQLRQEQASELGAQLQGGMFTKGEITNEVQAMEETEQPKVILSNGADTPGYRKYYYSSSSPLTTENRSYKRKIIGKV